jgi:hypothetical protein
MALRKKYMAKPIMAFVSAIVVFSSFTLRAESLWVKSYSGSSSAVLSSFCQTKDGGVAAAGYVLSSSGGPSTALLDAGNYDALVVKFNASFEIEWQKTFGQSADDYAYSIVAADDGGYVAAGETSSFGAGKNDAFVFRIDSGGDLLWAKRVGGAGEDWAVDVKKGEDGGFVVLGSTRAGASAETGATYKILLFELGADGDLQWQKSYGGSGDDLAYSLTKTRDGEYIITGSTASFGSGDVNGVVLRTDAGGLIKWQKFFGTPQDDYLFSSAEAGDGSCLLVGETYLKDTDTKQGESNALVIRIDRAGKDMWQKAYGFEKNDYALGTAAAGGNSFIITGGSSASADSYESWAIKMDLSGKIKWAKCYDLPGSETLYSSLKMGDGRILCLGKTGSPDLSNPFLVISDKSGAVGSSCDVVKESPMAKKWFLPGSGIASYNPVDPALKITGIKKDAVITAGDLASETICPAER